jgi:hypothetical protein
MLPAPGFVAGSVPGFAPPAPGFDATPVLGRVAGFAPVLGRLAPRFGADP